MALNLNELAVAKTVEQKMYSISINGVDFGKLNESQTEQLIGIIKGFQNGQTGLSLNNTKSNTKSNSKPKTNDEYVNVDLGKPTCIIGMVTAYKTLVRYWEKDITGQFIYDEKKREKFNFALRSSLTDAGATWNSDKKAYEFKTVKEANVWLKEQKAREDERAKKAK